MLPGSAVAASNIVPMLRQRERPSDIAVDLLPRFSSIFAEQDFRSALLSMASGARQVSRRLVLELNRSTQIHPCQMLCRFVG